MMVGKRVGGNLLVPLRLCRCAQRQLGSINDKEAPVLECAGSTTTRHCALILNDNLAGWTALEAHALHHGH